MTGADIQQAYYHSLLPTHSMNRLHEKLDTLIDLLKSGEGIEESLIAESFAIVRKEYERTESEFDFGMRLGYAEGMSHAVFALRRNSLKARDVQKEISATLDGIRDFLSQTI